MFLSIDKFYFYDKVCASLKNKILTLKTLEMDNKLLQELQKDTPFGLVNEIFAKGEFVCPVEDEIAENEELAGELTDYEKAIYLARDQNGDEFNALKRQTESFNDDVKQKLAVLDQSHDCLDRAFWASVNLRLADKLKKGSGVGVRKDWKIVSFSSAGAGRCIGLMIGIR